jgi:hypothetical protein
MARHTKACGPEAWAAAVNPSRPISTHEATERTVSGGDSHTTGRCCQQSVWSDPWPRLSRLNDDEIRRLTIDVVDRRTGSSTRLFDENTGGELLLRLAQRDPLPQWLLTGVSSRAGTD